MMRDQPLDPLEDIITASTPIFNQPSTGQYLLVWLQLVHWRGLCARSSRNGERPMRRQGLALAANIEDAKRLECPSAHRAHPAVIKANRFDFCELVSIVQLLGLQFTVI